MPSRYRKPSERSGLSGCFLAVTVIAVVGSVGVASLCLVFANSRPKSRPFEAKTEPTRLEAKPAPKPAKSPKMRHFSSGEKVQVKSKVVAASDWPAHEEISQRIQVSDFVGIENLITSGRAHILQSGDTARITELNTFTCKARIITGRAAREEVILPLDVLAPASE